MPESNHVLGDYWIDPNGGCNKDAIQVECQMSNKGTTCLSQHRTAPNKAAGPRRPPAPGSPSTRRDSRSTTTSPTRNSSSCVSYHPRPLSDSSMSAPHQSDGSMKSVAIMTRPFNSRHTTTMSSAMLQMSNDSLFKTLAR